MLCTCALPSTSATCQEQLHRMAQATEHAREPSYRREYSSELAGLEATEHAQLMHAPENPAKLCNICTHQCRDSIGGRNQERDLSRIYRMGQNRKIKFTKDTSFYIRD